MLFVVIARYATDAEVGTRRERVRDAHIDNLKRHAETGEVVISGPILDDAGTPKGSALILEFDSRDAVKAFLDDDLYSKNGIWTSFEIDPFVRVV